MLTITNVGTDHIKKNLDPNSNIFHITDKWGGIIKGGTLADRMWICGNPTGPAIPFTPITDNMISDINTSDNTSLYVFDDCTLIVSDNDSINLVKVKHDILDKFNDSDIDITDLR